MTVESRADVPPGREFNRRKSEYSLEIEWGSSTLTGDVRDIGPQGLFVKLAYPFWIGATFSARLILNPPLHLHCTVRRVEPSGVGVTFDLPEDNGRARLDQLLTSLPKV